MKTNHPTQDYTRWKLPEGAKARLGKGWTEDIAYTPDGTQLAVKTPIGIWLYDSQTGEEVDLLTDVHSIIAFSKIVGFSPGVQITGRDSADSITFSLRGKTIIARRKEMERDVETHLWDADTGEHIKTIRGHSVDPIRGHNVAISADGSKIASADDGAIHLWDVHTGTHIKTRKEYNESVSWMIFSPDENKIVSKGWHEHYEHNVSSWAFDLWDVHTGKHITRLASGVDGHESVKFSPNGDRIVVSRGSFDSFPGKNWFDLIESGTGKKIKTLELDRELGVTGIVFSPYGGIIAVCWDNAVFWDSLNLDSYEYDPYHNRSSPRYTSGISLWCAHTGDSIGTIHPRDLRGTISDVVFDPYGRKIASINSGGTIDLWDNIGKYMAREYSINGHSVAFSPCRNKIASIGLRDVQLGREGNEVYLWDAHTGEHIDTLKGHTYSSIAFSTDRKTVVGSDSNAVYLWDADTGVHIHTLTVESMVDSQSIDARSIKYSPDGKTIIGGSRSAVYLWDADTGARIHTLTIESMVDSQSIDTDSIKYSPDGKTIIGGSRSAVYLWDADTGAHIHTLITDTDSIKYSPDGKTIAGVKLRSNDNSEYIYEEGGVRLTSIDDFLSEEDEIPENDDEETKRRRKDDIYLWDAHTGRCINTLKGHACSSIVFSPDGNKIACSDYGVIYLWDVHTGGHIHTLTTESMESQSIGYVRYSPDGKTIAGRSGDEVYLWEAHTGKRINMVKKHGCSIIVFSPDGKEIVIDNEVWNAHTGGHICTLTTESMESQSIGYVRYSPDGKTIAGRSGDEVYLWEAHTGKRINTLKKCSYSTFTFSPDGKLVAVVNIGGTFTVCDVETGKCIKTLKGHADEITDIIFNSNSRTLATASHDGTVLLWDVDFLENEDILAEENTEFQNGVSRIQQFCEDSGITTLVHFTQIENLRSILHEGLLEHQGLLEKHGQQFEPNDKQRIDRHKETLCLSSSFPNYPLYYFRWVVLFLDAKILWELDCAFCQENAASNAVRYILFNQIPSDYIKEVHFYDETALKRWRANNPWINPEKLIYDQQYFQYVRDQTGSQEDNLDDDDIPFGSDISVDDDIPF